MGWKRPVCGLVSGIDKYALNPETSRGVPSVIRRASLSRRDCGRWQSLVTRTTKGVPFHAVFVWSFSNMSADPAFQYIGCCIPSFNNADDVAEQGHVPLAEFTGRLVANDVSMKTVM